MPVFVSPALKNFTAQIERELIFAQVSIARCDRGYELRHVGDHGVEADSLRAIELADLRAIAQFTGTGTFRPLKSAPTLRNGWRLEIANDAGCKPRSITFIQVPSPTGTPRNGRLHR